MKKALQILCLIIFIKNYTQTQNINLNSNVNISGTINQNVTVKVIDYTNIINQPMELQKSINDGVNRLMQEKRDRDNIKRENERKELEKQTNNIQVNTSGKMNQDDIDYYTTIFEKPIHQNEIKASSPREEIKTEKANSKAEIEKKFLDDFAYINLWILDLQQKLINKYGESDKITSAMKSFSEENTAIYYKYYPKRNLKGYKKDSSALMQKLLDFKLE